MTSEMALAVVARWLHILSATAVVGGALFLWCAFVPALREIADEDARVRLREAVLARWRRVLGPAIGFLLLSGVYNFVAYSIPRARELDRAAVYHALFGVKILAALAVFFLSSVLTGRAAAFEPMRNRPGKWFTLNALLAITVVLISGVLRNLK